MQKPVTIIALISLSLCTASLSACGNSGEEGSAESAPVEVTSAAVPAAAVLARLGGILIPAQEFHVELLPKSDGKVEAIILDAQGQVLVGSPNTQLTVSVTGPDQQLHPVQMTWDANRERYVGGADVQITAGPAEVTVNAGGGAKSGRIDTVVVASAPTHGGAVVLAGDYSVELAPAEDGRVAAWVVDAQGAPITAAANAEIKINVGPEATAQEVTLAWSSEAGRFEGVVSGQVDVNVAPMGVVVVSGGTRHAGRIEHAARGRVEFVAGGGLQVNTPGADVNVQPGGAVQVNTPGANVNVHGAAEAAGARVRIAAPGARVRVEAPGANVNVRGAAPGATTMVTIGGGGGVQVTPGNVRVGGSAAGGGVRVRTTTMAPSTSTMVSAMGGVTVGGGGGIQIGH